MAKDIPLKRLTEKERGILVEAIPLLRNKDTYYWEDKEFVRLYSKWMDQTKGAFHDEQPFDQFRMMIRKMQKTMPNTYELPANKEAWRDDGMVRKIIKGSDYTKGNK